MEKTDSTENILMEIRMKYAEDLERCLECPVCFDVSKNTLTVCMRGHHICGLCKDMLINIGQNCPICGSEFVCRVFVLERICNLFDEMKSSILDPNHRSNKVTKVFKSTQTDSKVCSTMEDDDDDFKIFEISKTNSDDDIIKKTTPTSDIKKKSNIVVKGLKKK